MVYFIVFPLLGGLIGWLTNYLAIKFLFRPRNPVKILGFVFQGVMPRRRTELALAVGKVVALELLSGQQVAAATSKPEVRAGISKSVEAAVRDHVQGHEALLLVPSGLRSWIAGIVAGIAGEEVTSMLATRGGDLAAGMFERLDVAKLVEERLLAMDWDQIEDLVFSVSGRELKVIELMGGILGAVIGVIQAVVVVLTQ